LGSVAFVFGNFGAGYVIDRIAPIQIIWLLFGSLVIVAAVSLMLRPIGPDASRCSTGVQRDSTRPRSAVSGAWP
jgi:hypothetical protein